jgi:ribosomal protein L40E
MIENWTWVARYVLVLVVALVLGGIIGELELFKQAVLGTPKLTAAMLARFLGYGGALVLFWLMAKRAADQFRDQGDKTAFLSFILLPLATLVVATIAYSVVLIVLKPFLDPGLHNLYNWLFVLGITISALWLAVALFHHSEPFIELFKSGAARSGAKRACKKCGAPVPAGAKFCTACGAAIS